MYCLCFIIPLRACVCVRACVFVLFPTYDTRQLSYKAHEIGKVYLRTDIANPELGHVLLLFVTRLCGQDMTH